MPAIVYLKIFSDSQMKVLSNVFLNITILTLLFALICRILQTPMVAIKHSRLAKKQKDELIDGIIIGWNRETKNY